MNRAILLSVFYFNQGLPYGFFLLTLPVLWREQGASATFIGSMAILASPWMLKVLWAPFVDRHGARRAWILAMQSGLFLSLAALSLTTNNWAVAAGVFTINMLIATQDIAVDGLAVLMLNEKERGWGNSIQAAAYKVGMLVGGGVLPSIALGSDASQGWMRAMLTLAALTLPALFVAVWFRESTVIIPSSAQHARKQASLAELFREFLSAPAAIWLLLFVLFSKFGDSLGTGMFRVFLVDHGWRADRIATVTGTYGLIASITGSVLMMAPLARLPRLPVFIGVALLQAVMLSGVAAASVGVLPESQWTALLVIEHFVSGMVTTVLFTLLMDFTPAHLPGSGFTFLTVISSAGMGMGNFLGGLLVDQTGFTTTFLSAAFVSLLPIVFLSFQYATKETAIQTV